MSWLKHSVFFRRFDQDRCFRTRMILRVLDQIRAVGQCGHHQPFSNLALSSKAEADENRTSTRSKDLVQDVFENGRRYCNTTYFMPNDEDEQTRLSIVHQIFLILLDGELTLAPVPDGSCRILDVGAGPGDWALDMSEQYPNAEIIATDIGFDAVPAMSGLSNVRFQLGDAEEEWAYRDPFDLIHIRGLSGAFRDWGSIYRKALTHLKPGGYIEVLDADPAVDLIDFPDAPKNSYWSIITAAMRSAAEAAGYPRNGDYLQANAITAAGFVDPHVFKLTVPVGIWPQEAREKTVGKMAWISLLEGLEAKCLRHLTTRGNWTAAEVRDLCGKVKEELMAAEGLTMSARFVTGRKPIAP
jgi:SAM-dependent methyltransferase